MSAGMSGFLSLGQDVTIYPLSKLVGQDVIRIGDHVIIDDFVFITGGRGTTIGSHVYIASFASITGGGKLVMGDFAGIATGSRILTGTDDFSGNALPNSTIPSEFRNVKRSFVEIGRHVVIGANCTVLPGVAIGDGAAIGACSVVTRDIEPWTISAGSPARKIGARRRDRIMEFEESLHERD